jgi:hypothetical protein
MRVMQSSRARVPRIAAEIERARAIVSVSRVDDASPAAGLFRRKFGHPLPDFPVHYIAAMALGDGGVVGYMHMTERDGLRLCGGLCVDETAYRRMSPEAIDAIRGAGGVARLMMLLATADCGDSIATLAYSGSKQSVRIGVGFGFERIVEPYTYAFWHLDPLPAEVRDSVVARARQMGAF